MREALVAGLPCLGICLGLHLLCDASDEGPGEGLGIFPGRVTRLDAARVPQIGWNRLDETTDPILGDLTTAYYANGYAARVDDPASVVSWSTHERDRFPAAVRQGRVLGVQFHPEKSSAPGLRFVRRFLTDAAP
jgi:glutamine amidotransferase